MINFILGVIVGSMLGIFLLEFIQGATIIERKEKERRKEND